MPTTFQTDVQLVDLPSELLKTAWRYWDESRKGAELPPIAAIDPTRLPKALIPNISIVAVEENPERFLLRLIGNAGVTAASTNNTGRYVDELPDGAAMASRLSACVSTRKPYCFEGPMGFAQKPFRAYRTLGLPFADGGKVTRLLSVTEFY